MVAFKKKDTIFAQGDATNGLSFIQKGKVQLSVVSESGKEATLGILSEGDFFGAAYRCRQFPCSQNDLRVLGKPFGDCISSCQYLRAVALSGRPDGVPDSLLPLLANRMNE
jgi:hypothetical protein